MSCDPYGYPWPELPAPSVPGAGGGLTPEEVATEDVSAIASRIDELTSDSIGSLFEPSDDPCAEDKLAEDISRAIFDAAETALNEHRDRIAARRAEPAAPAPGGGGEVGTLEPRGCPLPGACSCPAPQSPNARAKIICEFMGWPEDGPAWRDAHKLAASLASASIEEVGEGLETACRTFYEHCTRVPWSETTSGTKEQVRSGMRAALAARASQPSVGEVE